MADERDKVFDQVKTEPSGRNENLTGGKSTQSHTEEAKQEKQLHPKHDFAIAGNEPVEVKATAKLLPEDAERHAQTEGETE
jgi:hypothetical protein